MILTALLAFILAEAAHAGPQADTLCHSGEGVVFSCSLEEGGKVVSICTEPETTPPTSVIFRYGTRERIAVNYDATFKNKRRFFANVLPANPSALIKQMWFDFHGSRYVITECVGGRCSHSGGMITFDKSGVVAAEACAKGFGKEASFNPTVVDFGSDLSDSSSSTELIKLENAANDVESLYPPELTD